MHTSPFALFFVSATVVRPLVNVRYDDGSPILPFDTEEAANQYVVDNGLTYEEDVVDVEPFSLN
jgi:hypothetical protein